VWWALTETGEAPARHSGTHESGEAAVVRTRNLGVFGSIGDSYAEIPGSRPARAGRALWQTNWFAGE